MSAYLKFTDKENLEGSLLLPNGSIHSTLTTGTRTLALKGGSVPRQTTVVAESTNTRGKINWEARTFTIDGVERSVNTLRERVWDNKDKWTWGKTSYTVRFFSQHGDSGALRRAARRKRADVHGSGVDLQQGNSLVVNIMEQVMGGDQKGLQPLGMGILIFIFML
ncbi:hypothetical protein B0H14DRAFT_2741982 [Mycena olivaceomarginata]|nr:hypothetical protein B0H14DRAFT_2741982 [Mycena olivaceomarginata]